MSHNHEPSSTIDDHIRRAEEHHDNGRYQQAYDIYCEALAIDPENARLYAERGNELTWLGRREDALQDHNEAIRRDPTKAYYHDSRGRNRACMAAAEEDGDFSAAIADFTEAIRLDPTQEEYFTDRAAALRRSDPAAADADYRRAIELGTQHDMAYFRVAKYAFDELEDWDFTIEVCTAGLTIRPADGHLSYYLGRALFELEDYADAEPHLETAANAMDDNATVQTAYARCLYELDQFEDAIEAFDVAIGLGPTSTAWYYRGRSHWILDHNQAAYDDLSEAIRLEPDADVALAVRGKVLLEFERYGEALADLERAIEIDPEYREAMRWYAEALHENDRQEQALDRVLLLLDDDADDPFLFRLLGDIYKELDEYEEALDAYDSFHRKGGEEHAVLVRTGMCYMSMCENELAFEAFQKALKFEPDSEVYRAYCGIALERSGDSEESRRFFDEAIAGDPDWWLPYLQRGHSWEAVEEYELALADFDRAAELAPQEAKIRWARVQLHWQNENYEPVLSDCDALIEIEPENAEAYWQRALAWDELGRYDLADADADTAKQLEENAETDDSEEGTMTEEKMKIWNTLQDHFGGTALGGITLTERHFPVQVGADVQKALDSLDAAGFDILHFWSAQVGGNPVMNFADAYTRNRRYPPLTGDPRYTEIDIGEDTPVRALRDGLWLLEAGDEKLAMILDTNSDHRSIRFQIATLTSEGKVASAIFQHIEETVRQSPCYRGKILSLEYREMYSGQNQGLRVHRLRAVPREDVILPTATLELLDRNVTRFVQHRSRMAEMGLMAKKGLLFHGPPGTGKTHTIHYLSQTVPGQTTFLIAANQVTVLDEYMTLARLYQPSLVVIEDVDLIARQRDDMRSAGEELMLNKLLNEMDGLQLDAQVMFILTTNRPEALEAALASRPGRIDQAIEFPLPDAEGRAKLVRLYCGKFQLEESAIRKAVSKTDGLTASFMKELMRRAAQFALERNDAGQITDHDIEMAVEELLLLNGKLNRKLLGFTNNP